MVPVLERFRTGFPGEVSPVHLFWGSFDLAVTRVSGRAAPPHPGGLPDLPDAATREAHGHEVSSAGFWPGHGGAGEAMLRACAHPTPEGLAERPVASEAARRDADLGELLLPYEAVRTADDPADASMRFPQSTHDAAAETARRSTAPSGSRAPSPPSDAPRPATWGSAGRR